MAEGLDRIVASAGSARERCQDELKQLSHHHRVMTTRLCTQALLSGRCGKLLVTQFQRHASTTTI